TSGDDDGVASGSGSGSGSSGSGGASGSGGSGSVSVGSGSGSGGAATCDGADQKTSSGCDYYAVMPDITFDAAGGCFAAYVVNPGMNDVTVTVEYAGQTLDASTFGYIPKGSGKAIQYVPLAG